MKDTILFPPDSFEQVFTALVNRSGLAPLVPAGDECRDARRDLCRICHAARLSYQDEVQIKQAAFADFWKHLALPALPDRLSHLRRDDTTGWSQSGRCTLIHTASPSR
jgi:hypothetical protein